MRFNLIIGVFKTYEEFDIFRVTNSDHFYNKSRNKDLYSRLYTTSPGDLIPWYIEWIKNSTPIIKKRQLFDRQC